MTYEAANPGLYEPAQLGVTYRALRLQSNAEAVDLVVNSGVSSMALHLEPAELVVGTVQIVSGSVVGVIGYPRLPNSGA